MGHPKFSRRAWQAPKHPWQSDRIEEERGLITNYGLRNHREIWKARSKLRRWRNNAMKLIGRVDSSAGHYAREKEDMIASMCRKGLLAEGAGLDDVLQITVEHMLWRRMQSVVYNKGLAPTMRSARSLIVHGHISIGDQRMTVPGYHVLKHEEDLLQYSSNSKYADPEHKFRKDMEELRLTMISDEEEEKVEPVREATEEFIEEIKSKEAGLPGVKDTVPKEDG